MTEKKIQVEWTPEMSAALSRIMDTALRAAGIAALEDVALLKARVNGTAQEAATKAEPLMTT